MKNDGDGPTFRHPTMDHRARLEFCRNGQLMPEGVVSDQMHQNVMLSTVRAALAGKDIGSVARPNGLVDRIPGAGKAST